MNAAVARDALSLAKAIQDDVKEHWLPPAEVLPSRTEAVVPSVLFKNARGTPLVKIVHQINTTYEHSCFDACAVMIRRLIESLIIEAFEAKGIADEIKDQNDDFSGLSQLIEKALEQRSWNLSRPTKRVLRRLKESGDVSAHNRRYIATRHDIDEIVGGIRVIVQELLAIANLR